MYRFINEIMGRMREKIIITLQMIVFFYLLLSFFCKAAPQVWQTFGTSTQNEQKVVVIDAGHGGIDPGKVGIHGELEKDINLQIALKCKDYLEQQQIEVIMTREHDQGLYREADSNKKIVDMKNRVSVIEEKKPSLAVSIHQNSYSTENVSGPQVFYYRDSLQGKKMAQIMQNQLNQILMPQKNRVEKDNHTYYLLKKTSVPLVIVECGFLSNDREASLLSGENYQERVAWAIYLGIIDYLRDMSE